MQSARDIPIHGLFQIAHELVDEELFTRLRAAGFTELRPAHACVFGTITPDGDRLTVLAERADMTKQAVGEIASELEQIGYVERVPDPSDGRAKIIKLTDRGGQAWRLGWSVIADIQARWEKRYGKSRVREMVDLLAEIVDAERVAADREARSAA